MMRTAPTVIAALLLALAITGADAASPGYPCFRADAPPVIDGEADDACWQSAPLATGFSVLAGGFTDDKQTAFRLCWDDAAVYFLVACEEPDVGHLKTGVRDGGAAWLDDGVEIFLQPSGSGQVYQFIVTAAAAKATGAGTADFRRLDAAVSTGGASYTLEIAIPHDLVRTEPETGDTWRGNVCRNIWTTASGGNKFTSWAPLQRQFLEPESFAVFQLRGAAPPDETIAVITRDLNDRYRQYLVADLEGLADEAPRYLPVLERARESDELGSEARELCYRWYRLQRMQQGAQRYSIQNLRDMVRSAEDLLSASYEVKYAYLIDRLFPD